MHNPTKLRALAEAMEEQVQAKLNPPISQQRPTARRIRIARSMRVDGERLQRVQSALRMGADLMELDAIPDDFRDFRWTKANVNDCMGEALHTPVAQWVRSLVNGAPPESDRQRKIREAEESLYGCKIPGYFPTPPALAKRMVEMANLKTGDRVLEPSAGKGNIVEQIPSENYVHIIELNFKLRGLLQLKFDLSNDGNRTNAERTRCMSLYFDFLERPGQHWDTPDKQFNAVIMNPPFENGQDITHIIHAWTHLAPGGRLVAIAAESFMYRTDEKYRDFQRNFIKHYGIEIYDLPAGTFADSGTNVKTRLLKGIK